MKYWICIMIPAHIELVGGFIFFKVSPRFLLNDPIWLICSKGWNHQLQSVVPFFPLVICYGFHGSLLISGYAKELNWCINWGRYISRFSSFWAYFLKVVPMVFVLDVLILSVYFMKFRENYNIDNIYIYITESIFRQEDLWRTCMIWVFVSSLTNFSHESVSFFPILSDGGQVLSEARDRQVDTVEDVSAKQRVFWGWSFREL